MPKVSLLTIPFRISATTLRLAAMASPEIILLIVTMFISLTTIVLICYGIWQIHALKKGMSPKIPPGYKERTLIDTVRLQSQIHFTLSAWPVWLAICGQPRVPVVPRPLSRTMSKP